MLVTATDTETAALHKSLEPISDEGIIRVSVGNNTFFLGKFGLYTIAHVQCGMGSVSHTASIITICSAIDVWKPNAVIMIGIAFGKSSTSQSIGDVLVSESIIPYNIQKITTEDSIPRVTIPPAGQILFNRFKNGSKDWHYINLLSTNSKVFIGPILSGETLVDNLEYRDNLFETFPTAIGGEMEGVGLFSAANDKKVEWILVKGICDFADGNKASNKKKFQETAAESAVSLCKHICKIDSVFSSLGITPSPDFVQTVTPNPQLISKVLFDLYTPEKEKFYYQRTLDISLASFMDSYSIWVSGPSGNGKTTLILRNLHNSSLEFKLINFAHCVGFDVYSFFYELYLQIKELLDPNGIVKKFKQTHKLLEAISELLGLYLEPKPFFLFIEEIPLPDEENTLKDFIANLTGLLISHRAKYPDKDLKFLLSSIDSPKKYIKSTQLKIFETFKFISEPYWKKEQIDGLLEMLIEHLGIDFTPAQKIRIVDASKGSPRFIKNFLRDFILSKCANESSFNVLLSNTASDLNLS